jgi:hypothetical protein
VSWRAAHPALDPASENTWRSENEWPWPGPSGATYISGPSGGLRAALDWSSGSTGERGYDYVPTVLIGSGAARDWSIVPSVWTDRSK